ncbi:DegT/DnrJ/EryC1/StrS family aminotransferase [Heliobacterium chlorum]|uniref:DegT/DnrJ/EryC1/StrS family aminotransferase n=1 Tax=Heliobacterium chlorum TaxID=2698 RepID=A0ABR7T1F3_HELCL|nr:DegT/DnrJ/EryC1/StrS family aminotransferase [Heliobacterium chlorum]
MTEQPLWEALLAYRREGVKGFHMPGHGQGRAFQGLGLTPDLDVTEIPGLDDLHAPEEAIAEAQAAAARAFGAQATFFLVQGATVGIHALCMSGLKPGDEIVLPRHCHRSLFGALVLSGAVPRYIPAVCEAETGLPLASDPSRLEESAIGAKALFMLRPSYFGTAEDLAPWLDCSHRVGIPLWVDEAHGAAYPFSDRLPESALKLGAHAVVHGSHKTLPVLTQAAMLHIGSGEFSPPSFAVDKVRRALSVLQTTSPSYLLLASLDLARSRMEEEGQGLWEHTAERAQLLRKELNRLKGISCWGEEIKAYPGVTDWDPTRLLVVIRDWPMTGYELRRQLREKYGIEAELAGSAHILFLISPFDDDDADTVLLAAFRHLAGSVERRQPGSIRDGSLFKDSYRQWPQMVLTPREAFFASHRVVSLSEARDQIAAEFICPYPPGIPLVAPGEKITPEMVELIGELQQAGVHWQGSADPKLTLITVIDK